MHSHGCSRVTEFFTRETAIRVKLVEPHNLLSSIVTVCSWLGPDNYNYVTNLGQETLQQLSSLKSVYHPILKKNTKVIVRGAADGCQRRSIAGSSSASSTYPIPESTELKSNLGIWQSSVMSLCGKQKWLRKEKNSIRHGWESEWIILKTGNYLINGTLLK